MLSSFKVASLGLKQISPRQGGAKVFSAEQEKLEKIESLFINRMPPKQEISDLVWFQDILYLTETWNVMQLYQQIHQQKENALRLLKNSHGRLFKACLWVLMNIQARVSSMSPLMPLLPAASLWLGLKISLVPRQAKRYATPPNTKACVLSTKLSSHCCLCSVERW